MKTGPLATAIVAALISLLLAAGVKARIKAPATSTSAKGGSPDTRRDEFFPAYHVRPERNWINDPNGPFRDPVTGIAHLWMQYNPYGATWGNMSWYHVVSRDLVKWNRVGVSLTYQAGQRYNDLGVFSGSVTLVTPSTPAIFYTCASHNPGQRQCIAWPKNTTDPLLTDWIEDAQNPVLPEGPVNMQSNNFRDPTTGWRNPQNSEEWLVAVGVSLKNTAVEGNRSIAAVQLYSGKSSFEAWKPFGTLYSNEWEPSGMFECPDFYSLPTGTAGETIYVLKTSNEFDRMDYYRIGQYDTKNNIFVEPPLDRATISMYDYGTFYASKTYYDPVLQQRILWGWINEDAPTEQFNARGWAGMQSLPRVVSYDTASGTLRIRPLPALEELRGGVLASTVTPSPLNSPGVSLLPYSGRPFSATSSAIGPLGSQLQQEIKATFSLPSDLFERYPGARVGLRVREASTTQFTAVYVTTFVESTTPILNNTNIDGGDYIDYPMNPSRSHEENTANCSRMCKEDLRCLAWTYVKSGTLPHYPPANPWDFAPRCSLKNIFTASMLVNITINSSDRVREELVDDDIDNNGDVEMGCCVSGVVSTPVIVLNRTASGTSGQTAPLMGRAPLAAATNTMELHLFSDHSIMEVFKDDGMERLTSRLYVKGMDTAGVSAFASGVEDGGGLVQLVNATIWSVDGIWLDKWN